MTGLATTKGVKKLHEEFIKKAKEKHGDKYSYELINDTNYNYKNKVPIICQKHKIFFQQPNHHLSGRGCAKCGRDVCASMFKKTLTDEQITFLKNNIEKMSMVEFQKEFKLNDQTIRKEMKRHNIKWISENYGPIYEDIPKNLWNNLLSGAKSRNLTVEITPKDIWDLFIKQNKLCALSGIEIYFGKTKRGKTTASVDRIDSNLGYIITNIQIVHKKINQIKTDLSQDDFIYYCTCVANKFNNKVK
jgi:hypothetical protein